MNGKAAPDATARRGERTRGIRRAASTHRGGAGRDFGSPAPKPDRAKPARGPTEEGPSDTRQAARLEYAGAPGRTRRDPPGGLHMARRVVALASGELIVFKDAEATMRRDCSLDHATRARRRPTTGCS